VSERLVEVDGIKRCEMWPKDGTSVVFDSSSIHRSIEGHRTKWRDHAGIVDMGVGHETKTQYTPIRNGAGIHAISFKRPSHNLSNNSLCVCVWWMMYCTPWPRWTYTSELPWEKKTTVNIDWDQLPCQIDFFLLFSSQNCEHWTLVPDFERKNPPNDRCDEITCER
jgi:hypothetical protein